MLFLLTVYFSVWGRKTLQLLVTVKLTLHMLQCTIVIQSLLLLKNYSFLATYFFVSLLLSLSVTSVVLYNVTRMHVYLHLLPCLLICGSPHSFCYLVLSHCILLWFRLDCGHLIRIHQIPSLTYTCPEMSFFKSIMHT